MATEKDLQEGLVKRADLLATALHLSVDMPNVNFTIPIDKAPYLQTRIFRNATSSPNWDDGSVHQGFLQIGYIVRDQDGSLDPMDICSQIVSFFDKGTEIWNNGLRINVEVKPTILTEIQDGEKSIWPVSIPYVARPM